MGMNFTCYIGHKLNGNDLSRMSNALNSGNFKSVSAFIEEILPYNPEDVNKKWKTEFDSIGGTVCLNGPCGLSFTFSEHVCMIDHYTRWITFILNDLEVNFRAHFRNIAYELSRYFESSFSIYVPDNATKESAILDFIWDDENRSIDYIKDWLLTKCGDPKLNIEDIYKDCGDYWESDGYFIDYFKDYTQ
ncbi:hypothetical protein K0T92_02445 [Paenibacillus oenotherae]|uniref:Uncharacterized protein n=1 Tax=Paenibacillus oenotherae TaxID=1435645 RepID=A0ABS7D185_9BACL|nr:hypothetical protein [Paenibacillus oenotherae]MBW7473604.1 hypothetical protein [Paenibacillus oenotherae]